LVSCTAARLPLPSFPTRRSSDLSTPDGTPVSGTGPAVSLTVIGVCGTPATFTITNTGTAMTQPHGYYILSGLNQTVLATGGFQLDRKSTRLNSSHVKISYAVFCL